MTKLLPRIITAALLGAFIFSSIAARASEVSPKKNSKIEPIRIVPKKNRSIASEDDGFIPLMQPKPSKKKSKKALVN